MIWSLLILTSMFIGLTVSLFYLLVLLVEQDPKYPIPKKWPFITIIIPVWNEGTENGARLRKTLNSVLDADYPKDRLEIIIVNDGSTDNSLEIVKSFQSKRISIITRTNSLGKSASVNEGIQKAKGEFIVALDADSFINPDVLKKTVVPFVNKNVMAVIPAIKIWKPTNLLQHVQFAEFFNAVFVRYLQSKLGSIPLAPGAFTLLRKSFVIEHKLMHTQTMVEDLEVSLKIQSEGYLIENVIDANVYTSGVKTIHAFVNQRLRWFCGFLIQMKKYKHLVSTKHGNLGIFVLPISIIYVFTTIILFIASITLLIQSLGKWVSNVLLVGVVLPKITNLQLDFFFYGFELQVVLPILLLIISLIFTFYIKRKTKETQPILKSFVIFILTYWLLGAVCWIIATYYYIRKKPIKWGANYFTQ